MATGTEAVVAGMLQCRGPGAGGGADSEGAD